MGLTPVIIGFKHIFVNPSTRQSGSAAGFSTAQLLDWADLNAEMLRYWKGTLPPIAGRDGRSSRYTLEEVVALGVIGRATNQLRVPIKNFAPHAQALFDAVAAHISDDQAPSLVIIHEDEIRFGRPDILPDVEAFAIVRIDRVLLDIRGRMMAPAALPSQLTLFQFQG
jgi:hypothetical protein